MATVSKHGAVDRVLGELKVNQGTVHLSGRFLPGPLVLPSELRPDASAVPLPRGSGVWLGWETGRLSALLHLAPSLPGLPTSLGPVFTVK